MGGGRRGVCTFGMEHPSLFKNQHEQFPLEETGGGEGERTYIPKS